ncbi:MAG: hypothetical protein NC231_07830 [Bacillus sp. (in: Bacteria)]|nr:hypothetical protein [Bacillus sp. (in: firmicutes)]MCM1425372.1 hypothetical protein [Eubacterium sp.]
MDYNQLTFGYNYGLTSGLEDAVAISGGGYDNMSDDEKREYIERHRSILSKSELDRLTASLGGEEDDNPHFEDPSSSIFRGPGIG